MFTTLRTRFGIPELRLPRRAPAPWQEAFRVLSDPQPGASRPAVAETFPRNSLRVRATTTRQRVA